MYALINKHIAEILTDNAKERIFTRYLCLRGRFREVDVSQDAAFQKQYKGYWTMGRQSQEFYRLYFRLLQESKCNKSSDVKGVVQRLYDGENRVHFSFATKLVHMCNPHLPVYDSVVRAFFFLPEHAKDGEVKVQALLKDYEFLIEEYGRVIRNELLGKAIGVVRTQCGTSADLTDEKVIDALIWTFVTWVRKSPGRLQYQ